jgi:hypothetical protein
MRLRRKKTHFFFEMSLRERVNQCLFWEKNGGSSKVVTGGLPRTNRCLRITLAEACTPRQKTWRRHRRHRSLIRGWHTWIPPLSKSFSLFIFYFFILIFEERLRWMLDGERGLGRSASSSPSTVGPLGRVHGFRADIVVRLYPLS